ncbi:unnamed protein product [Trichobilharzia regenti]|nr:unnamed protein product [Trichobilharzia regenti]
MLRGYGGGVASPSIILIEPDFHQTYSKLLLNLFTAEGILSGHAIFYGATETFDNLLCKLPDITTSGDESKEEIPDLRIAWRYQNLSNVENPKPPISNFGHQFNLSLPLGAVTGITEKKICSFCFQPNSKKPLQVNLSDLSQELIKFQSSSKVASSLQRIESDASHDIVEKQYCSVKLPPGLFTRISHYCDYVFRVQGLGDQIKANPVYSEYDGLLAVMRIPWMLGGNTLEPAIRPSTLDWCFKIKRHQLTMQVFVYSLLLDIFELFEYAFDYK